MENMTWREDTQAVFEEALRNGVLSRDEQSPRYFDQVMYMGTVNGVDQFKNARTRQYLTRKVVA